MVLLVLVLIVPNKFRPKMPEFVKQLKLDDAIDNAVREIKLLQDRCKHFFLKIERIDESV